MGINFLLKVKGIRFSQIQLLYLFLFCLIMPLYGLIITFMQSYTYIIADTSYIGFSSSLTFLIPVLYLNKDEFYECFIKALRALSVVIFTVLTSFLINGDQVGISQFFIDHNSMLVGFREYAGIITYYLYFTASPLLIILVSWDCNNLLTKYSFMRLFLFIFSVISVFLTGTRFNMLFAILILPISIIFKRFSFRYFGFYLIFLFVIIALIIQNSFIFSFFDSSEASNSVKSSYFQSYFNILSNPGAIIFGHGFSAIEWSATFKNMLSAAYNEGVKAELTYVEMIRVFGLLVGGLLNIAILFIPFLLYIKYKELNAKVVGVFFYLLASILNPYIFSTNGVLIFLLFLTSLSQKSSPAILTYNRSNV